MQRAEFKDHGWEAAFQRKVVDWELQHWEGNQQLFPVNGSETSEQATGLCQFHMNSLHLPGLPSQSRKVAWPPIPGTSILSNAKQKLEKCWSILALQQYCKHKLKILVLWLHKSVWKIIFKKVPTFYKHLHVM